MHIICINILVSSQNLSCFIHLDGSCIVCAALARIECFKGLGFPEFQEPPLTHNLKLITRIFFTLVGQVERQATCRAVVQGHLSQSDFFCFVDPQNLYLLK